MKQEYQEYIDQLSREKEKIKKQFKNWKKKKPKDLDAKFHQEHENAFEEIDCLSCANCCKTTSPIFRDVDIKRIAKFERVSEAQYIDSYLMLDEEGDYVLKNSPCHYLDQENKCFIYEIRPLACREYPHTDRKNMHQILDLTAKNTEICPAVAKIVGHLL